MKETYKELRKKLKDEFKHESGSKGYAISASVGLWVKQCGIRPTPESLSIICIIFGAIPYPYQEKDRTVIIEFLKNNKYKSFKKMYLS